MILYHKWGLCYIPSVSLWKKKLWLESRRAEKLIIKSIHSEGSEAAADKDWKQNQHQASHSHQLMLCTSDIPGHLTLVTYLHPESLLFLKEGWLCSTTCLICWLVSLVVWFVGAGFTWSIWPVCAPLASGMAPSSLAGAVVYAGEAPCWGT